MKSTIDRLTVPIVVLTGFLSAGLLSAQTLSFQATAPTPTANDQYNLVGSPNDSGNVNDGTQIYLDGADNDGFTYVANGRANIGQFFTTGAKSGGYHVAAVWIQQAGYTANTSSTWYDFAAGTDPTFIFRLTDPSEVNATNFALDTETVTVTGTEINNPDVTGVENSANGTGVWLRFGFSSVGTNILLQPNTKYGFDVMGSDGDFFETLGTTNKAYAGGGAYIGSATAGAPDDTTNLLLGDRVFLVEMVGDNWAPEYSAPSITNKLANQIVPLLANAAFTPGVSGTTPLSYHWYFNTNTLLTGQTNATLAIAAVTTNSGVLGRYSVVITNSYGSVTSSFARLAVELPTLTTNCDFNSSSGGTILDEAGVATPFSARLAGTGAAIPTDDTNLLMDASAGFLEITSPTFDFNGQLEMDAAEAVGINLSALGFNGTQGFVVTGYLTNSVVGVNYDQAGIFAGTASTNQLRGGIIYNSDFVADPGAYGVGNENGYDVGIATAAAPSGEMVVSIAQAAGVWSMSVNGLSVTPSTSMSFLSGATNYTVGVFALNTSGTTTTTEVNEFSVSLFSGPKLQATAAGGKLTLSWNVVGAGLESSTDLSNTNAWAAEAAATASPYVIALPTSGSKFYRIAK